MSMWKLTSAKVEDLGNSSEFAFFLRFKDIEGNRLSHAVCLSLEEDFDVAIVALQRFLTQLQEIRKHREQP